MNIKELTYYIQSANINFLIGSGASRPYLATLGSIEKLLTRLNPNRSLELTRSMGIPGHLWLPIYL